MDNTKYINNSQLVYAINRELIRIGEKKSFFPIEDVFEIEKLNKIIRIELDYLIDGVDLLALPNLKTLIIYNCNDQEDEFNLDLSVLKNLEELILVNNNSLKSLNINGLNNLKKLIVNNNINLTDIYGLDELKELKHVNICGNKIHYIGDIVKYINNTKDTKVNILDIMMYHTNFGNNLKIKRYLENQIISGWSNITFGEMLMFDNKYYKLDYYQMRDMDIKAKKIIKSLITDSDQDIDKVYKIFMYIVRKLKYDHDTLNYRSDEYFDAQHNNLYKDEYLLKRYLTINSSYGAIMQHKAVCEGYVNMMRLLLDMCGIESEKVSCQLKESEKNIFEHVAIRFKINDTWYYADPEREQIREGIEFFGLTKEEFKVTHYIKEYEDNTRYIK